MECEQLQQISQQKRKSINEVLSQGLKVPRYQIDLQKPAKERWLQPLQDFKSELLHIEKKIEELGISSMVQTVLGWFKNRVFYIEELKGIAEFTNWDLNKVIMMQLIYEASAHCTSVIGLQDNGAPILGRTMEWEMPYLRPITIEVEFINNNTTVAIGTTWVGYVGILTGMSMVEGKEFGVSVNFRQTQDSLYDNVKQALSSAWPIGFLLRETLCDKEMDYKAASVVLAKSELIAPVYFTVCGKHKNEGRIITRDRKDEHKHIHLGDHHKYLVQTNIDHWSSNPAEDICYSIGRREKAKHILQENEKDSQKNTELGIWKLLSTYPIMSEIVIYGVVMNPSTHYYQTRLTVGKGKVETFIPKTIEQIVKEEKRDKCSACGTEYYYSLNTKGMCAHKGDWHSNYSDCNKIKCGMGLRLKDLGLQHYSCCYQTDINSKCKKSDYHVPN